MTVALTIISILAVIMYAEGALLATVLGSAAQKSRITTTLIVLFWPLTLPFIGAALYKKFSPMIAQFQMISTMMQLQQQSPADLYGTACEQGEDTDTQEVSN